MDTVLKAFLNGLYGIGTILLEDDKADIANPRAHPGLHHWHIGAALVNGIQAVHALDAVNAMIPATSAGVAVAQQDPLDAHLEELVADA